METEQALWDRVLGPPGAPGPRLPGLAMSRRKAELRPVDQIVVAQDGTGGAWGIVGVMLAPRAELRRLWAGGRDER